MIADFKKVTDLTNSFQDEKKLCANNPPNYITIEQTLKLNLNTIEKNILKNL